MDKRIRPDDIEALVADFEASDCTELHIRFEGFELHLSADPAVKTVAHQTNVSKQSAGQSARPSAAPAPAASGGDADADSLEGLTIVRAPYLGTFYRAPKPGEPSYVEVGSIVSAENELCLVEVMKLFTAVRAGIDGTIARILAADGQMVEAGQPLFAIDAKS